MMSTRNLPVRLSFNSIDTISNNLLFGTNHVVGFQKVKPGSEKSLQPELRGKLLYIISGVGEVLNDEDQCVTSFKGVKVLYLPHNRLFRVRNLGDRLLKYLVVAKTELDPLEEVCGITEPSLLFRYFREGEEHYENGGIFMRNVMYPDTSPLKLPVIVSDFFVSIGDDTEWKKEEHHICHVILEGEAELELEGEEARVMQAGDHLIVPSGVMWKIKNLGDSDLNVATVQDVAFT
jgi:mannose-6-phosphate isomerase-like protein (cupin superfamily)